MKTPPRHCFTAFFVGLLATVFAALPAAASTAPPGPAAKANTPSTPATPQQDNSRPFGKDLENRLSKAKLLETRSDGTKVYQEADGTKIYLGDHSVAIISGSTSYGTVEFGTKPDGAATVRLGSIVAAAGTNGEIVLSDEHSGTAAAPEPAARQQAKMLEAQAKLMQEQAARLQKQADELKALANTMEEAEKKTPIAPAPDPKPGK